MMLFYIYKLVYQLILSNIYKSINQLFVSKFINVELISQEVVYQLTGSLSTTS